MTRVLKEAPLGRQRFDFAFKEADGKETKALIDAMGVAELPVGYTAGWASTADLDLYGHVVMPGAFDKSIAAKGLTGPKGIRLLLQHDRNVIAGVIKVLKTIGTQLWIEAQLNMENTAVKDFYSSAKMVGGVSFSVGFYIEDYEFKSDSDGEILYIKEGELEEVSVVTFPGNPEAMMTFLKTEPTDGCYDSLSEFEKALRADGLVTSRNAAARLTLAVKKNIALFQPAASENAPVAKAKIEAISSLVGDLKALF